MCGFFMDLGHVRGSDVMVGTRMNDRSQKMVGRHVAQDHTDLELALPDEEARMKSRRRPAMVSCLFGAVVRRCDIAEDEGPKQL